jgi:segregation and condensation protein B
METNMRQEENFEEFDAKESGKDFDGLSDDDLVESAGEDKEKPESGDDSEFEDDQPEGVLGSPAADDAATGQPKDETIAGAGEDKTSLAQSDLTDGVPPTLEAVVEAVLFASDESLNASRLAKIAETSASQVRRCVDTLNERYKAGGSAFRIEQIAGGYQMLTLPVFDHWLKKLITVRGDSRLSPAALETLAIISYKQPIIRADIEAIRGVQCGEVIRSLMYKGLVKIVGRAEILGRPMQYGTTKKFLEVFGLNSLKDLPKVEELKKPEQ